MWKDKKILTLARSLRLLGEKKDFKNYVHRKDAHLFHKTVCLSKKFGFEQMTTKQKCTE